jgi:nucleoside-diphosphate-sugar epimerase
MKHIFVTGGTGYLGGYACTRMLAADPDVHLDLMIRAPDRRSALDKLWHGWQLHMSADELRALLPRLRFINGDLHADDLGIRGPERQALVARTDSILHIAASLNRKSEHACLNTNLRGTLGVLALARQVADAGGLTRFSFVSTAAVAGRRWREVVTEDQAIEWDRRQYDPYARTKSFCEDMVRRLLPDVPILILRPSTVMGDSRHALTTQWDMVRAFVFFADLPVVPWGPDVRQDVVNADWVGDAVAHLHLAERTRFDTYHLAAGTGSRTSAEIARAVVAGTGGRTPRFGRRLHGPFEGSIKALEQLGPTSNAKRLAALIRVFLPYVSNDTVFDNGRVVSELGRAPTPFDRYGPALFERSKELGFRYPFQPLPPGIE